MTALLKSGFLNINIFNYIARKLIIPCSSMAEQEAVNFKVVGSNPTGGATFRLSERCLYQPWLESLVYR